MAVTTVHRQPGKEQTFATGADPVARFEKLIQFCRTYGFTDELQYFQNAKSKLDAK